jgi:hypothetical protein
MKIATAVMALNMFADLPIRQERQQGRGHRTAGEIGGNGDRRRSG